MQNSISITDSSISNKSIFCGLLNLIGESNLNWTLLDFEGMGKLKDLSMPAFEEAVKKNGCAFSWQDLNEFISQIDDFIWISIIGHRATKIDFHKNKTAKDYGAIVELSIDCVDGSLWEFTAQDPSFFKKINSYLSTIGSKK